MIFSGYHIRWNVKIVEERNAQVARGGKRVYLVIKIHYFVKISRQAYSDNVKVHNDFTYNGGHVTKLEQENELSFCRYVSK